MKVIVNPPTSLAKEKYGKEGVDNKINETFKKTMGCTTMSETIPIASMIFFSCAASPSRSRTVMTDTWKDKEYQGKPQKIMLIMVAKSPDTRELFENRFAGELQGRGNDAFQSYTVVPFEQLRDKEVVKAKIRARVLILFSYQGWSTPRR